MAWVVSLSEDGQEIYLRHCGDNHDAFLEDASESAECQMTGNAQLFKEESKQQNGQFHGNGYTQIFFRFTAASDAGICRVHMYVRSHVEM
jgi:hypothetical protein